MVSGFCPYSAYFNSSPLGWAVKDSDSRYVYGNSVLYDYFAVTREELCGATDAELTPDISDCHDQIAMDDKKVMTTGEISVVLKTFDYGRKGRLRSFLVEKRPWTLANAEAGIVCTYIEITNIYFSAFMAPHERKSLMFTRPTNIFTDKEWEVVLLLQCGVKQPLMSDILGVSASTLRNRLTRCCDKAGVTNGAALLQLCSENGWDNYIPPFFLNKGHVSIFTAGMP